MPRSQRSPLLILLPILAALLLAGCSLFESSETPEVEGEFGETPTITVPDSEPPSELQVEVLEEGSGDEVEAGALLVANYLGVNWDDGETFDSSFERGEPTGFGIGVGSVIPGWDQALVGQNLGSRVLVVVPPDLAYGEQGQGDIPPNATLVFVVDLIETFEHSDNPGGTPVTDLPNNLPTVTGEPGEEPTIDIETATPRKNTRNTVIVEGSGDPVPEDAQLAIDVVQQALDSPQSDSTWGEGQSPLATTAQAVPGLQETLAGVGAGTRVVTEISAEDAGGVPVVLVIDVVGSF